ncbi:MAG TPA: hypothetical protein VEA44_01505 [Caulobacter sp.]|nr:hypothetical protein [Caulobacter sp.]
MNDPFLSPGALVAAICALTALALGGYFLVKRLDRQLGGPHHTTSVWAILAIFAIPLAVCAGMAMKTDNLFALGPAMFFGGALARLAPRMAPLPTQLLALALAFAGIGGTALVAALRATANGELVDFFLAVACILGAVGMLLATVRTLTRPEDKPETGSPA